jgi:tripartite-type tricarboxylate transporter receptor subunit TctC
MLIAGPRIGFAFDYPMRPVRIIVPVPAGGSTDHAARLIGEYLSRTFGQQFFVDNRPGGGGNLGIETVAHSVPDGNTVLIVTDRAASAPHIFKLSVDPLKDLVPVIQISRQPVVLAVHRSLAVNSMAEFKSVVQGRGAIGYATSGVGTEQHLVGAWFAKLSGLKLEHVPYRGGGQAINDLIAGHIQVGFLGSSPLMPHYKSGTLQLLAQSSRVRSPSLPDVPTFQETGTDGLVLDQWIGAFVPAGTPDDVITRLNDGINRALSDVSIRAVLLSQAQEPIGGSAQAFFQLVKADFEKYDRLVKDLGITADPL